MRAVLARTEHRGGPRIVVGSGGRTRTSRCVDLAQKLAANAGRNVGETGEIGDAATARVNAIGLGGAAALAYNASYCGELSTRRDIGLRWRQRRYDVGVGRADSISVFTSLFQLMVV